MPEICCLECGQRLQKNAFFKMNELIFCDEDCAHKYFEKEQTRLKMARPVTRRDLAEFKAAILHEIKDMLPPKPQTEIPISYMDRQEEEAYAYCPMCDEGFGN